MSLFLAALDTVHRRCPRPRLSAPKAGCLPKHPGHCTNLGAAWFFAISIMMQLLPASRPQNLPPSQSQGRFLIEARCTPHRFLSPTVIMTPHNPMTTQLQISVCRVLSPAYFRTLVLWSRQNLGLVMTVQISHAQPALQSRPRIGYPPGSENADIEARPIAQQRSSFPNTHLCLCPLQRRPGDWHHIHPPVPDCLSLRFL
jgi:hypothetical protein